MDRVTRAKLESLIHQLQTHGGKGLGSVEDVARRLQLDPMIVQRVAEQQGVTLRRADEVAGSESSADPDAESDPNQSTQVMSLDELHGEP